MIEETNQAVTVDTTNNEGAPEADDSVKLTKAEYEKIQQDLGSLKRENKLLKKPKETSNEEAPEDNTKLSSLQERLDKQALKAANITHEDDVELARKTAAKWNMDIDEILDDEDFKAKLERQQTNRANIEATAGVKGDKGGSGSAKNTPEYWIAKGVPPTPDQVPDRKTRATIVRAMMADSKQGKTFYND